MINIILSNIAANNVIMRIVIFVSTSRVARIRITNGFIRSTRDEEKFNILMIVLTQFKIQFDYELN